MTATDNMVGTGLLLVGSAAYIILIEVWTRRTNPKPELSRKVLHIGGLIPCLIAPLVIHSIWLAFLIGSLAGAGLYMNERFGLLKCVSRVQRETSGTAYYPIAVFLVFVLSSGRSWMYISALLALCLADALAAVVGKSFARIRYGVENQWKSLEGSAIFFLVTFVAVLLPLMLMTSIPFGRCLLAALLTALLVTGLEAISLNGLDNLFIPIGVCIVLDRIVLLPWTDLLVQNLMLLGLVVLVTFLTRVTRQLDFDASLVFILFTYSAIALADWLWALAPLCGLVYFLVFRLLFPPVEIYRSRVKVLLTVRVLLPLLLVLAFAYSTNQHAFLQGPYLCCASVTLCFSLRVFLSWRKVGPPRANPIIPAFAGAAIAVAVAIPAWALQGAPIGSLVGIAGICAILMAVHEWTLPHDRPKTVADFWTMPRLLLAFTSVIAIMLLQQKELVPIWPQSSTPVLKVEA